jgi:hypothetical protein
MVRIHYHIEQSTPRTDKIFLDSAGGCGLSSLQPASKQGSRPGTAPEIFADFLRLERERVLGVIGNISNTNGSCLVAVLKLPELFKKFSFKKRQGVQS